MSLKYYREEGVAILQIQVHTVISLFFICFSLHLPAAVPERLSVFYLLLL